MDFDELTTSNEIIDEDEEVIGIVPSEERLDEYPSICGREGNCNKTRFSKRMYVQLRRKTTVNF